MPKIELQRVSASPKGVFTPGTVIEVDKSEADALVESGQAKLVEESKKQNKGGNKKGDK
ncbi:hypothetical protein [Terrihalobacillus insolitus]|uniref:hypothetical protein n=1 Tax=Terrihalobacillus insolitus TaxID=2950438 RepID=UPI0023419997|nr:hypothetical protein [Terrihalobacillus insolitus]MDC3414271.1 hypothetical protein [Terrihalobacillus insolitus]